MGGHLDQSHKTNGGQVLSGFRAQLLITMEGQQNLICHRWLNTPSIKAFSSNFQIVSPAFPIGSQQYFEVCALPPFKAVHMGDAEYIR